MKTSRELETKLSSLRITLKYADDKHQKTYITAQMNLLEWMLGLHEEYSYGVCKPTDDAPEGIQGLQQAVNPRRAPSYSGYKKHRVNKSKVTAA